MLSTFNAACCKYPLGKTNKCPVNELIHDFRYLPNYTIVNLFSGLYMTLPTANYLYHTSTCTTIDFYFI